MLFNCFNATKDWFISENFNEGWVQQIALAPDSDKKFDNIYNQHNNGQIMAFCVVSHTDAR